MSAPQAEGRAASALPAPSHLRGSWATARYRLSWFAYDCPCFSPGSPVCQEPPKSQANGAVGHPLHKLLRVSGLPGTTRPRSAPPGTPPHPNPMGPSFPPAFTPGLGPLLNLLPREAHPDPPPSSMNVSRPQFPTDGQRGCWTGSELRSLPQFPLL